MAAVSHQIHIDKPLSEFAIGYRPEGFIADMLFPVVNVQKQSDLYVTFSRADALRRQDTKRAPGTEAKLVTRNVSSNTYFASNYALKAGVTIEDKSNADPIFYQSLVEGRAEFVLDHLLLDWEIRVANMVTSGSNVGSSAAVSSAWNGAGNPLGNINTAIDNVHFSNGVRPNRIAFGIEAWNSFRRDTTVRDLIFGVNNGGGYPNTQQVAQLLNVDEVYVAGAFRNTADEGVTETLASVWRDNVLVYYAPKAPTIERPSFGYSIRWAAPGLPNMQVERLPYDPRKKTEEVEVGYYQSEVITGSSYGFLLKSVNSST